MSGAGKRNVAIGVAVAVVAAFLAARLVSRDDDNDQPAGTHQNAEDAYRHLVGSGEGTPVVHIVRGFPEAVRGVFPAKGETPVERARDFLTANAGLYGLTDQRLTLNVRRVSTDPAPTVIFTQSFQSLPVYGSSLAVTTAPGFVLSASGRLLHHPPDDVTPATDTAAAVEAARAALGAPSAPILGTTELVVFDLGVVDDAAPNPRLAWRVTVGGDQLAKVLVDAHDRSVLFVDAVGTEDSGLDSFDLDLEDAENDASAETDDCYWTSDEVTAGDEEGVDDDYQNDNDVTTGYAGSKLAYQLFHGFGFHSYDDDGGQMEMYFHAAIPDGPNGKYVPCSLENVIEFSDNFLAQDVVVHEWTHAVIYYSSQLKCCNQTGALNESYADVMASVADGNWTNGESMLDGLGPVRNLANPPDPATRNPGPDKLSDMASVCPGSADNGRRHCKAGVPNKAHFLMADGGSFNGQTVTGIGKGKMGEVAVSTMTNLPSNATFLTARNIEVSTAEFWRAYWAGEGPLSQSSVFDAIIPQGYTHQTVCSIMRAWAAVEVGAGDTDCDGTDDGADGDDDNDGIMDAADNCPGVKTSNLADFDGDGLGDACDDDDDGDGVKETKSGGLGTDNCPGVPNPDQKDGDYDGLGAACDPDDDNDLDDDGKLNEEDNCPHDANANQKDTDNDGDGDACDPDNDGDGKSNDNDNCPFTPNADQSDKDGDGLGDSCDKCPDAEDQNVAFTPGIPELGVDPQPFVPDGDGDGIPDACDPDPYSLGGRFQIEGGLGFGSAGGQSRAISTPGIGGGEATLPLDPCGPSCPDGFDADTRLAIECTDLGPGVVMFVTNEEGLAVAGSRPYAAGTEARFHPEAGVNYFVHFLFHPSYVNGTLLQTSCLLRTDKARSEQPADAATTTTTTSSIPASDDTVPPDDQTTTTTTTTSTTVPTPPGEFAVICDPTTLTVRIGQTASARCTLESRNAFAGSITMACNGLPPSVVPATCAFDPNPVSLAADGQAITSMALSTNRTPRGTYHFDVVGTDTAGRVVTFAMTLVVT